MQATHIDIYGAGEKPDEKYGTYRVGAKVGKDIKCVKIEYDTDKRIIKIFWSNEKVTTFCGFPFKAVGPSQHSQQ